MSKKATSYKCFSEKGEVNLPIKSEVLELQESGIEPTIYFDSCVCLHIIKVVDYGKNAAGVDLSNIIKLKEYISKIPIKVTPFFGLLELCMMPGGLNENKFWDFKHRFDFFESIPIKEFKKFKYDFRTDYLIVKQPKTLPNPYKQIEPSLKNIYCALLKLRSLAKQGLSKYTAEKTIYTYLDWTVDVLKFTGAVEYKLALNVLGGNTAFRKMIGLDCKISETKKRLKGTTWDIFHSKFASNSFRLHKMFHTNIAPYFLTSDANLFSIFKNLSLTLIKDGGENFSSSFLFNSDFSFPHLKEDFIIRQNEKMMDIFIDSRNKIYEFEEEKVNNLIKELEIENQLV